MKFEYDYEFVSSGMPAHLAAILNDKGEEGWELVAVDNGVAWLKRTIPTVLTSTGRVKVVKREARMSRI